MQAKQLKVLLARFLARRIEVRRRRLRRALRDYQRTELRRISAADRRARGLRLYAAWAAGVNKAADYRMIVPLRPPSDAGEANNRKIRVVQNISA
jgi:hypothetical protein